MTVLNEGSGAPEAPETGEASVVDTNAEGSAPSESTEQSQPPQKAKPKWEHQRIGTLSRQNAELRDRLREFEQRMSQQTQPQPQQHPSHAPGEPQGQINPNDLEDWIDKQAEKRASSKAFIERCNAVSEEGKKLFPDFDESMERLGMTGVLNEETLKAALAGTKKGDSARVLHYLGTNPDRAQAIFAQSTVDIAADIAELRHELSQQPAVSNAPKPLRPERGGGGSEPPVGTRAWFEMRNKQEAERRKR